MTANSSTRRHIAGATGRKRGATSKPEAADEKLIVLVSEAATAIGVNVRTLNRWKNDGLAGFYEGGRCCPAEIIEADKQRAVETAVAKARTVLTAAGKESQEDYDLDIARTKALRVQHEYATEILKGFIPTPVARMMVARAWSKIVTNLRQLPFSVDGPLELAEGKGSRVRIGIMLDAIDEMIKGMSVDSIINGREDDELEALVNGTTSAEQAGRDDEDDAGIDIDQDILDEYEAD